MNHHLSPEQALPQDPDAVLVGRVFRPGVGPSLITVRGGVVHDITAHGPTMSDLLEREDAAAVARDGEGEALGSVEALLDNSHADRRHDDEPVLLAPNDLQAVKAAGVTFIVSLLERVIEEQARGDASRADEMRARITSLIGMSLSDITPGSEGAEKLKAHLIQAGAWSQYLEVGIGPDAEIFTKAQPLSTVGTGDLIGLHPKSEWNNPEPEVVLAVNSRGQAVGAALGNDVNLRDFEGRSALLLSKAKDNNASSAIGPFFRLFDKGFTIDDVRRAHLTLVVEGEDDYRLEGQSTMSAIARDPLDLVGQTVNETHQYPDGFVLFLGTMFAPTEDRGAQGKGFTHELGDVVSIHSVKLGTLVNRVAHSDDAPPWTFGVRALMRNLSGRGLL